MIQISGDLFLELHPFVEVGSRERGGGPRRAPLFGGVRFSFASEQRHKGYCSNNLEKTVQVRGLEMLPR